MSYDIMRIFIHHKGSIIKHTKNILISDRIDD